MTQKKLGSNETPEIGAGVFHKDAGENKITKGNETQNILISKIYDFIKIVGEKIEIYKEDFSGIHSVIMITRIAVKNLLKKFKEENTVLIEEYEELYGPLTDEMLLGKQHYEALDMKPKEIQIETKDEIDDKKIDLIDIMTLVDKLDTTGKQMFFHNLSEQANLSENIFNLLLKEADSKILYNLCLNVTIAGNALESLVQKLIAIAKGVEQVPLVTNTDDRDNIYEENDTDKEDDRMVSSINSFVELLLKNHNLTSQQIEDIMNVFDESMNYRFQENLCKNPNTPSWILEKMYEINPHHMKAFIFANPNLSPDFKEQHQEVIK